MDGMPETLSRQNLTTLDQEGAKGRPSVGQRHAEAKDHPPSFIDNVFFWLVFLFCWLCYFLVSIVYLSWAIMWHGIIIAAIIPFGVFCWWRLGRQIFIYTYVIMVMLPAHFLWINIYRRNRRRYRIWDFEMGKPRALPIELRRKLSVINNEKEQSSSSFFARLPLEIRRQIYREIIIGDTAWFNMVQGRVKFKEPNQEFGRLMEPRKTLTQIPYTKLQKNRHITTAYPSLISHTEPTKNFPADVLLTLQRDPALYRLDNHIPSALALLRTCKQVYHEAIPLFYSLPTFKFAELYKPPFIFQALLPHRLALIRSIHLVHDSRYIYSHDRISDSAARFRHQISKCTFCNPLNWLKNIQQYLTGLEKIQVFIFLDRRQAMPTLGNLLYVRLLELQIGTNGLRDMSINLTPTPYAIPNNSPEDPFAVEATGFLEILQARLDEKARDYRLTKTKEEPIVPSGALAGNTV